MVSMVVMIALCGFISVICVGLSFRNNIIIITNHNQNQHFTCF